MSIKIHANRVLGTIHVTQTFLGVFEGAQIKSGPKAPTDLNAALVLRTHYEDSITLTAYSRILFGRNNVKTKKDENKKPFILLSFVWNSKSKPN